MNDALNENASALANMAAQGDDLTQARDVEFAHVFEDRDAANAFSGWAQSQGYVVTVEDREDAGADVIVRQRMVPELLTLTDLELALTDAARDYGGEPDGWGCFAVLKLHS